MEKITKTRIILHEIVKRLAQKMAIQEAEYEKNINNLSIKMRSIKLKTDFLNCHKGFQNKKANSRSFNSAVRDIEKSINNTKQKIADFRGEIKRGRKWLEKTYGDKI